MPIIGQFDGIDIYMYYNDHEPPHFHVFHAESEGVIDMATLRIIKGTVSQRILRKIHEWAHRNRDGLSANWERCRAHLPPTKL